MKDYIWDLQSNTKFPLLIYGEKNHVDWNTDISRIWGFKQFVYGEIVL